MLFISAAPFAAPRPAPADMCLCECIALVCARMCFLIVVCTCLFAASCYCCSCCCFARMNFLLWLGSFTPANQCCAPGVFAISICTQTNLQKCQTCATPSPHSHAPCPDIRSLDGRCKYVQNILLHILGCRSDERSRVRILI